MPDEGAEDVDHANHVALGRILDQSPQGVNAAQADRKLLAPKLLDRAREALGDMALFGDAGLIVGGAGLVVGSARLVDRRVGARRRGLDLSGGNPGAPKGEDPTGHATENQTIGPERLVVVAQEPPDGAGRIFGLPARRRLRHGGRRRPAGCLRGRRCVGSLARHRPGASGSQQDQGRKQNRQSGHAVNLTENRDGRQGTKTSGDRGYDTRGTRHQGGR